MSEEAVTLRAIVVALARAIPFDAEMETCVLCGNCTKPHAIPTAQGEMRCNFCHPQQAYGLSRLPQVGPHKSTCPWLLARELVAEADEPFGQPWELEDALPLESRWTEA